MESQLNVGKSMAKEFMDFIKKFGVIGLAIGVVTGKAVGDLVASVVANLVNPVLGFLLGGVDLKNAAMLKLNDKSSIMVGAFIGDLINFLVLMLIIFLTIKFFIGKFMDDEK
jgi:large conductance mechanosensitive channel